MADEPPSLPVGTGVSAKYKGAFCEAKIRKVVRSVKCKVLFKNGLGSYTIGDDQIKGNIRTGAVVEARHPEKKDYNEATITKIQDGSQYTVVFDDGDITTLRRTALCLKSGKHFAESETLDQLPLTHPEHFSTPVIGGRRGRRTRIGIGGASSDDDESFRQSNDFSNFKETDIGRVVCVEGGEKRKNRDNWFPGLIVAPTAQESVPIRVRDEYLVRSFKDGRYYTVPKKEITEFSREMGAKAETNSLKTAVEKALQFLDRDELPLHWDRDLLLYGVTDAGSDSDPGEDNESSDDEPREKKDHFVAQLYKFMDENGTPINEEPVIGSKDVDLFRLYKVVHNLGGFNRVTNQNNWKNISVKLGFGHNPVVVGMVKQSYRKYLLSFEEWPKRPGCSMQIQPRLSRSRYRVGKTNAVKECSSSPVIKTEKDKVEKQTSTVCESIAPKGPVAKPVPPSVTVKEPPLIKPPVTPVVKDKPTAKKLAQQNTVTPTQVKSVDGYPKTFIKDIKVEPGLKLRNPKYKPVEPEVLFVKQEIKRDPECPDPVAVGETSGGAVKDKKKRIGSKEKPKKELPLVKGGKVDCLANTRQKRVIKERLKTVADSIKGRSKASTSGILESSEKAIKTGNRKKLPNPKYEPSTTLPNPKYETSTTLPNPKYETSTTQLNLLEVIKKEPVFEEDPYAPSSSKKRRVSCRGEPKKEVASFNQRKVDFLANPKRMVKERLNTVDQGVQTLSMPLRSMGPVPASATTFSLINSIKVEVEPDVVAVEEPTVRRIEGSLRRRDGRKVPFIKEESSAPPLNIRKMVTRSNCAQCMAKKALPAKLKIKEEGVATAKIKKEDVTLASATNDDKRKGRKKKDVKDAKERTEMSLINLDVLPTYKTISVGDKLKVYYGPTKEAKITSYEAKVLSTKEENGETLYFVHYTGWNTRYDEWIRSSRVADNLSWVAGKASKKQAQVTAPKSTKKEKKSTKNENLKLDHKTGTSKDVAGPSSSSGSSLSSSKDQQSVRQGSVGRSTTPSSIASSSSRSKSATHKRPATRAAQTKKDDETTQDFESDGGSELEESKSPPLIKRIKMESNSSPPVKSKNPEMSPKGENPADDGITIKVEKDDHIENDDDANSLVLDSECAPTSPNETADEGEGYSVKIVVKSEYGVDEDDNPVVEEEEEEDEDTKEDDEEFEELTLIKEEELISPELRAEDRSSNTVTATDCEAPSIKAEEEEEEEEEDEEEEYDAGDSKGPSESENSDCGDESNNEETHSDGIKPEVKIEDEIICNADLKLPNDEVKDLAVIVTSNDTDTEDVYEFKEPEPFEFEARKSSDDKGKGTKRSITLSVEDKPSSPKIKRSLSPDVLDTGLKISSFETAAELLKDDTSPESTPTIQTCEEAFDKICASPLRAAALDSRHIEMLERLENYEDDDNFDDDSEDRLVISERDSDNCSNTSFDKDSEILAAEYSNSATEVNELKASPQHDSQSKELFPKDNDGDDEEELEDEAISTAIQSVMNLETSEDSSDEEMIPIEDNTVSVTEVESVKMEENDSSSEMQDLKNLASIDEENKADDNSGTDESPPHLVDETEKDRIEASIEQEEYAQKESEVIDICPEAVTVEDNVTVKEEDDGGMMVDLTSTEIVDVEEDENNIDSLICEETIPGSPPSHLEVLNQNEEKHQSEEQEIFKSECDLTPSGTLNEPDAAQQIVQVVRVEHSPPTIHESDASSPPSPLQREPEATPPLPEKKPEKEVEIDSVTSIEPSSYKKDAPKMSATESRPKKVEVKAPAKRGRKSKKKNDESSTRKKYARHSKHQGSESDDGYDGAGGSGRADSSRSRSPHMYHLNFLIPTDKLSALDVSQKIVQINQAMQNLRTAYNNQKTELAAIDKRRKRIRRREREDAARLINARSH